MYRLMVQTACVVGAVQVQRRWPIFSSEKFFDFPVVGLGTDAEFEVFLGDRIPVLLNS